MDLLELGDMGRRCEDENCSLPSGFPENCSNQECHGEEPIFGLIELVCVTVIYIPLMVFGLLGNTLTILVVWLRPHMRSSTYLYLSSMAVSDLLILLLLPLDLYKLWRPRPWPLGDLACKVTMFLSECCTFCTILHITFLSLERYLAVCWPITAKILVTRSRTKTLIGCLWLGAVVSAAPVLVMVGVEDVGIEELGVGGWREGGGLTSREGEQGGFMMDGSGHTVLTDGGLEGINWEEKEKRGLDEGVGELKWFGEKGERKLAIRDRNERKQGDKGGSEEEGRVEVEGEQQNKMKEDEGGGRDEGVDGGYGGGSDNRECRCTHYAVSSGLLSAMTIVSNLYFLVPLCILGLVYSLIGRTLWLRPQSSRRDQSHRHTVKMLGVIVLAFVLCWLPFHVGRTIFSLSLGSGSDGQETYPDTNSHLDINTPSDVSTDRNINTHASVETHLSDTQTHTDINTQSDDISTDKHLHSHVISHTRGQHMNSGTSTHKLDRTHTATHAETHNDTTHGDTQLGRFTDNRDTNNHLQNSTNTTTNNGTQITHIITQVSHLNTSFHNVTTANTHTNRLICTDVHTLTSMQNATPICINSRNSTLNYTPPTAGTNTYAVTPTNLYNDTHDDAHLYFLYYLSQYFNLVSSVLFYLSAAVNPLLYNLMSARYRHAVHSLIYTQSHTPSHRLHTLTAQHSTTTL